MSTLRAVKRLILVLLGVTAVTVAPALADPIPVTADPQQGLLITYYGFSLPAWPPFGHVTVTMNFEGWDPGEVMMFDFFDGQQGQGYMDTVSDWAGGMTRVFDFHWTPTQLLDGQFSIGYRLEGGVANLASSFALINGTYVVPGRVTPPGSGYIIPEPDTWSLLALGFVGIALLRRERRAAS